MCRDRWGTDSSGLRRSRRGQDVRSICAGRFRGGNGVRFADGRSSTDVGEARAGTATSGASEP